MGISKRREWRIKRKITVSNVSFSRKLKNSCNIIKTISESPAGEILATLAGEYTPSENINNRFGSGKYGRSKYGRAKYPNGVSNRTYNYHKAANSNNYSFGLGYKNRVGRGYKYYVPRGVTYLDTDETNEKLYSNGNYYYLYIDVVSYYQKIANKYDKEDNIYYSREFTEDEGFSSNGYLKITEKDNLYYIDFVYNYATIETVVDKNEVNDAVLNSAYILSTIQFNKNVIDLMIDSEKIGNREEKYEVFKNKEAEEEKSELQVNED